MNSRLPVSTSVRRPTSIAKQSTSFVGINRPSAIPSTLRKYANELFTPQAKTPVSYRGASTAGKSYRPAVATEKKYKKPLPEREELQQMFDTLVDFIKSYAPNLPLPEAKKFFSSVSTTESTRIFQLLIGRLLSEFKITRLETDVPEALAALEYPYIRSVTKSSLVSVTSKTAATSLLVIFDWLIKQIQAQELAEPPYGTESTLDEWNEVSRIKLLQPERCKDVFPELLERLYNHIEDMQTLMNEREEIQKEHERMAFEVEEINDLDQEKLTLEEDIIKCKEYKDQMKKYSECKLKECDDISHQRLRVSLQIEEIIKRSERGQLDIKSNEVNMEEVLEVQTVIQRLESELTVLGNHINEASIEYEQWKTKKQSSVKEKIQEDIHEELIQMKRLYEFCDSQKYQESSTLIERKLELGEWIRRMEQLSPDDIVQDQRVFHDFSLYIQKFQATDPRLESEIWDQLSKVKSAVDDLMMSLAKYERDIIPRLQETFKRIEHEKKVVEMQFEDEWGKTNAYEDEKSRQLSNRLEIIEKELMQLEEQDDREIGLIEKEIKESAEFLKLIEEHVIVTMHRNEQEELNLLNGVKKETQRWKEAQMIAESNNKIIKAAHRMLRKRLNLDKKQELDI